MPQDSNLPLLEVISATLSRAQVIESLSVKGRLEWTFDTKYFLDSVFPIYTVPNEPTFLVTCY
jgi:hypothetical protein